MPKEIDEEAFLKEAKVTLCLATIQECFTSIRGDWTNPKHLCKTGLDAVTELCGLLGRKP